MLNDVQQSNQAEGVVGKGESRCIGGERSVATLPRDAERD